MNVDRFWAKVDRRGPDECWPWVGKRNEAYGRFMVDGQFRPAHRVSYELLRGPIPAGLQIDHLCRNPRCVNPAHLEPVTQRENGLRGMSVPARNARKTHCKWGHEFTPENTRWTAGKYGTPHRHCKACHNRSRHVAA